MSLKEPYSNDAQRTSGLHAKTDAISDEHVRERAYDIWERHHRPEGFEMQFWLIAKRELIAERETKIACAAALEKGAGD